MAGIDAKMSSSDVLGKAENMEQQNSELNNTLEDSYTAIQNLKGNWQSPSADAMYSAFDKFRSNYFENYKNAINEYVKFLREVVVPSYEKVEKANADSVSNMEKGFL